MKKVCLSKKNFDKLLNLSLQNCNQNSSLQPSLPISLPSSFISISQTIPLLSGDSFILEIDTSYGNKIDLSSLKIAENNVINIDWGDNSSSQTPIDYTHTYSNSTPSQKYKIIIYGNIVKTYISSVDTTGKPQPIPSIISIVKFPETCTSISLNYLNNLTVAPQNLPISVTDLSLCFANCKSFNQDLSSWDVSNVTNMAEMFAGCTKFNNGDLPRNSNKPLNWNVGKVTNMTYMFSSCTSFNQDISNWNVENVTDMNYMFFNTNFNKNLYNWLLLLDNKVVEMSYAFGYVTNNKTIELRRCFDINTSVDNKYSPNCIRSCNPGYTPRGDTTEICMSCSPGYYSSCKTEWDTLPVNCN